LWATLFSAASPTLAAFVLSDRPAALGQMLGLPAGSFRAADEQDHASHADHERWHHESVADAHHDGATGHSESADNTSPDASGGHADTAGDAHHDGSHQSHGVYCSLCLNPSSLSTVAPLPPALWLLGRQFDLARPEPHPTPSASFLPHYRSRAPPATS
jgi:hypothetical protein